MENLLGGMERREFSEKEEREPTGEIWCEKGQTWRREGPVGHKNHQLHFFSSYPFLPHRLLSHYGIPVASFESLHVPDNQPNVPGLFPSFFQRIQCQVLLSLYVQKVRRTFRPFISSFLHGSPRFMTRPVQIFRYPINCEP